MKALSFELKSEARQYRSSGPYLIKFHSLEVFQFMDLNQMFIDIRGLNMLSPSHLIF